MQSLSDIKTWTDLLDAVDRQLSITSNKISVMTVLKEKLTQLISKYAKNKIFSKDKINDNHVDTFNMYVLLYEQILIEIDPIDIFVDINGLDSEEKIMFHIIGPGKWIKLHCGAADRIFFYDDEQTILSDRIIADYVNKINNIRSRYKYFGTEPAIYYKFKTMPNPDIIEYLDNHHTKVLLHSDSTPVNLIQISNDKVILDQSAVLTMCSNLSYGLSTSYFLIEKSTTSEEMVDNRIRLEKYLDGKELYIASTMYAECKYKIDKMAGDLERDRFNKIEPKLIVIPDEMNNRFYYLKDNEALITSTAEKYLLTIVTGNLRLCNKLSTYYREMKFEHFYPAQLSETKYM